MIKIEKQSAGLYLHLPFCLSKCGYCSFYSVASSRLIPEFVQAVIRECMFYTDIFRAFDTIYLGGGTPSLISVLQLQEIFEAIFQSFEIHRQAEITIEVNPGDVSMEYFRSLRQLGINRLNIGIQAFDDHILRFLGRRHTVADAVTAIGAARTAGFDNIGMDFIYGVCGQDLSLWQKTLNQVLSFSPEHLSCYQLSLEASTPLYRQYQKDGLALPSETESLDFFMKTSQMLTDASYIHYEVSNFARSDAFRSRHNMKYWRHIPYLGLGPAAHSFVDRKRWWNKEDVNAYIKDIAEGKVPLVQSEELSGEQLSLEALFLGLRTKEGLDLTQYKDRYRVDLLSDKKRTIDELIKNKLVELRDDRLCPTLAGMAVADSLALI